MKQNWKFPKKSVNKLIEKLDPVIFSQIKTQEYQEPEGTPFINDELQRQMVKESFSNNEYSKETIANIQKEYWSQQID
jgi:hypothetical protein